MAVVPSSFQHLAFGADARQRLRLKRSVFAACVYVVALLAQWASVALGLASGSDATQLAIFCASGQFLFLLTIRTGLSMRFADAALTMPQMVFAILSIAFAYHVNPACRASVTILVPLVLVFGAFILPARQCVALGWFAVAVFAATIGYGAWFQPEDFPPVREAHIFGFVVVVLPTLAHLAGQLSQLRIDQRQQGIELRDAMERLKRMATHDPLTGLPNRRHVDERIADVIFDARRAAVPLCVAILDLDRFKRINDLFGHAAGDEVLRIFAREASTLLRDGDLLARWGGEEFLLVLPGTNLFAAQVILERMRKRLAASAGWAAYSHPRVTFSAGLALLRDYQTLQQALQCADFALYDAKTQGRDRVVVAQTDLNIEAERAVAVPRRLRVDHPSNIF